MENVQNVQIAQHTNPMLITEEKRNAHSISIVIHTHASRTMHITHQYRSHWFAYYSQPENHHRISVQDHRATSKKRKRIFYAPTQNWIPHTHTPNESHEYFINKFICYLLYRNFPIAAFWIAKVANATRVCLELKIHCIAVLIGELHEWWGE